MVSKHTRMGGTRRKRGGQRNAHVPHTQPMVYTLNSMQTHWGLNTAANMARWHVSHVIIRFHERYYQLIDRHG